MSTIAGMYMCEVTTTRQLLTKVLIFKRNLKKRRSYHYRTHRSKSCLPCILLSITIEHREIAGENFQSCDQQILQILQYLLNFIAIAHLFSYGKGNMDNVQHNIQSASVKLKTLKYSIY